MRCAVKRYTFPPAFIPNHYTVTANTTRGMLCFKGLKTISNLVIVLLNVPSDGGL